MFHARGERQRSRLDCRRGGVPQAPTTEVHFRVRPYNDTLHYLSLSLSNTATHPPPPPISISYSAFKSTTCHHALRFDARPFFFLSSSLSTAHSLYTFSRLSICLFRLSSSPSDHVVCLVYWFPTTTTELELYKPFSFFLLCSALSLIAVHHFGIWHFAIFILH